MNKRKFDDIEAEFLKFGVLRGGTLMFKKDDAIRFIERCREKKYPIYGLDGFFLTESATQPSHENSIDFDLAFENKDDFDPYNAAINFIKNQPFPDMYFEIVHDTL